MLVDRQKTSWAQDTANRLQTGDIVGNLSQHRDHNNQVEDAFAVGQTDACVP